MRAATLLLLLLVIPIVAASPIPPSAICEVQAKVIDYDYQSSAQLLITDTGDMVEDGMIQRDCYAYAGKTLDDVLVLGESDLRTGQTIKANIWLIGDEWGSSYVINDITVLREPEGIDWELFILPVVIILGYLVYRGSSRFSEL